MIPSDLATRLRALTQSTVQPLSAVQEIAKDLPTFEQGERFTASVLNQLPDGTFRALVAGKAMTLALPEAVKSGDVLELVVTEQREGTVFARTDTSRLGVNDSRPSLSQTGQLISQLLTGRFGEASPTPLAVGKPLLPSPPTSGQQLAPVLQDAVQQSGVFYEAHLRNWVEGKQALDTIRQEPQALTGTAQQMLEPDDAAPAMNTFPTPLQPSDAAAPAPAQLVPSIASESAEEDDAAHRIDEWTGDSSDNDNVLSKGVHTQPRGVKEYNEGAVPARRTLLTEQPSVFRSSNDSIPERIMPLVHQQLEALATQQIAWQGQVWPGTPMTLELFDPERDSAQASADDEPPAWRSALRLSMPILGDVDALVVLGKDGVTIRLDTGDTDTAARLRTGQQDLASALEAAGLKVAGMTVTQHADA